MNLVVDTFWAVFGVVASYWWLLLIWLAAGLVVSVALGRLLRMED